MCCEPILLSPAVAFEPEKHIRRIGDDPDRDNDKIIYVTDIICIGKSAVHHILLDVSN